MHTLKKSLRTLVVILFLAVCFPLLALEAAAHHQTMAYEEPMTVEGSAPDEETVMDEETLTDEELAVDEEPVADEETAYDKEPVADEEPVACEPEYTPEAIPDIPFPDVAEYEPLTPTAYVFSVRGDPFANEIIRLVNIERFKAGLAPVETHAILEDVARLRAQEGLQLSDTQFISHVRPNGQRWYTAFAQSNVCRTFYWNSSENVARRFETPEQIVNAWMNSPPHRDNMLSADWITTGVAVARNDAGRIDVVQIFCAAS